METKFCKFCQCDHPLTDEWWNFGSKNRTQCKAYQREYQRKYRNKNRNDFLNEKRAYYQNNKSRFKEQRVKYCQDHKVEIAEYQRAYRQQNADHLSSYKKAYDKENADKLKEYVSNRLKADINYKLRRVLRVRICNAIAIGYKAGSAVRDLGCTIPELKQHLESKFQEGMAWANWGLYGWHIDHIIPLSSFDLTDREQFLKACHYTNLQPLWAEENLKKSDKVALSCRLSKTRAASNH